MGGPGRGLDRCAREPACAHAPTAVRGWPAGQTHVEHPRAWWRCSLRSLPGPPQPGAGAGEAAAAAVSAKAVAAESTPGLGGGGGFSPAEPRLRVRRALGAHEGSATRLGLELRNGPPDFPQEWTTGRRALG